MANEVAPADRTLRACAAGFALALAACARPPAPPVHPSAGDVSLDATEAAAAEAHLLFADAVPTTAASAGSATSTSAAAPTTATAPEARGGGTGRTVGWVLVSVGSAATALAIGTSFLMLHRNSVRSDECNAQKLCSRAGLEANSALKSLGGWNAGAWALGVVGLGAGAFLVLSNPTGKSEPTAIGISPNGSGMGLDLRSAF
jgi:hypothetical protein